MDVTKSVKSVTERIIERSRPTRELYLSRIAAMANDGPHRGELSCGNLAHGFAACGPTDRDALKGDISANLGIITSYNDMLSAHQPYQSYPDTMKQAAREIGASAQVAGGVPAMCDGVTQGQPGMDLSLFSRDVIAMAAAIGLSHNMYDAAAFLGICDKIVPGLLIAALTFGHLPSIFVPAGPMPSGLPNDEKVKVRNLYAEGKVGRKELMESEIASYHSPGTCTFYGTANSNQMLMEIMGLHLPGSSFVSPNTPLREALTKHATQQILSRTSLGDSFMPVGQMVDERVIVNGLIGLLATGGSTNHTLHLIAIAAAAGIAITWEDMSELSDTIPLLARVYPNGLADVNHFDAAGGLGFLMRELLKGGLLHGDVETVVGQGLDAYTQEPKLVDGQLAWHDIAAESGDDKVVAKLKNKFSPNGGLKLLTGNLGKSVIKVSAVNPAYQLIEAPAKIFHSQDELKAAFKAGKLEGDFIAVVRFCGPKAMGMPELHSLTPPLSVLLGRGQRVALVTDGRMSGASGKVPAAIHLSPEAFEGGPIAQIQEGDMIRLDCAAGTLEILVDADKFAARPLATQDLAASQFGLGRELFAGMRGLVGSAETGASLFGDDGPVV